MSTASERRGGPGLAGAITALALALTALGLLMIYSSSTWWGARRYGNPWHFIERQAIGALLGVGVLLLFSFLPYRVWRTRAGRNALLGAAVALLVLVLVAGRRFNGARRWLRFLGTGFQPSELAKLAAVVWAAGCVVRRDLDLADFRKGFLPAVLPVALLSALTLVEPDFGTAFFIGVLGLFVLALGGMRMRHLLVTGAVVLPAAAAVMIARFDYVGERFRSFFGGSPGYQVRQSLIALGSGGLWGRGIGAGTGKLFFLPEVAGDFIFPSFAEEAGFVGAAVVILLFGAFLLLGFRIARKALAHDPFAFFLATGIAVWIGTQAAVNLAVVSGSAPTKGIALPFISYGSSSLVVTLAATGILANVARSFQGRERIGLVGRAG